MTSESYGQSFEYDEGSDEADESFEAADEGADEADESFEASDEGTDEADEFFEAADESFEASDEGADEADESFEADEAIDGEALSAKARLSAREARDKDRNRRQRLAAQLATDRKREVRASSAVQQSMTNRLRNIRGAGRTGTTTVGNLNGVRAVQLRLANGRTAMAQVVPPLASASEVNRLGAVLNKNERRRAASDAANSRAISQLAAAQAKFVKSQTAQQVKSDRELGNRIVQSNTDVNKRITTEVANQKANLEKQEKRIVRRLKKAQRQSLMNDVLLASALPFVAAYGERGNPFAGRNLAQAGILAGWLVGDEVIGMAAGVGKSSKAMSTLSTAWSTVAPVGNGLSNYLLFRNELNDRFVSGVTSIKDKAASDPVQIAKESSAFAKLSAPPVVVVATVVSGAPADAVVNGTVKSGKLTLTLKAAAAGEVKIAWVLDTKPDAAPPATT